MATKKTNTTKKSTLDDYTTLKAKYDVLLENTKTNEKFYDISKVTQIQSITKRSPVENYLLEYLKDKVNKNGNNICLQCKELLLNTKFVFIKNTDKTKFNDNNLFTIKTIARVIRTLAYKNSIYLGLKATKNADDFNIVLIANTLEEFEKFYSITKKTTKKTKATPDGNKETKDGEKKENVSSKENDGKSVEELKGLINEIFNNKTFNYKQKLDKIQLLVQTY